MGILTDVWTWLTTGSHWTGTGGVLQRLGEHIYLTGVCLLLSCALALPLALWLGHVGRGGALAVNLSNAGRAVPTFAVLVLLSMGPLGRYGDWATIVRWLVLFALPPLLTNAYTGVREADREVVEAARGMGMTGGQLLRQVELPLALPLIMTGVQTAAVQLVATATLAALPGGGGLGRLITAGFGNYDTHRRWSRAPCSWPRWRCWSSASSPSPSGSWTRCGGSRPAARRPSDGPTKNDTGRMDA